MVHKIAKINGIELKEILFKEKLIYQKGKEKLEAVGLAHCPFGIIELRLPKKINRFEKCLRVAIHELAHILQYQRDHKAGHENLENIIRGIYTRCGWTMGHEFYWEESICKRMVKEEI